MITRFLVYGLVDPRTGEVFYVGKSHRGWDKAMRHLRPAHIAQDANAAKLRRIAAILCAGMEPQVWPLAWCRTARELAEVETQLIRQWSRVAPLANRTNNRAA
jgi:hypothetical protein